MKHLKIIFLQPDFSGYASGSYQHDFLRSLAHLHRVYNYGPGLPGYDAAHTAADVLQLCPFKPDLICVGAGWEDDRHPTDYDLHPALRLDALSIPRVMLLNKEYKKLDEKFKYIRQNNIQLVFTAHHHAAQWQQQIGVPFVHLPFAVNHAVFKPLSDMPKTYDLGFSGNLHLKWTPVRAAVKKHLFAFGGRLKRFRYRGVRIYWREWDKGLQTGEDYARLIAGSSIWLSTPSAIDLVGTRFYEIMATGTLLMCSRSSAYGNLFSDGRHCVMFSADLSDLDEKLFYYLTHQAERTALAEAGRHHVLAEHTWDRRAAQFTEALQHSGIVKGFPAFST